MAGVVPSFMDAPGRQPAQALLFEIEPFAAMRMGQAVMAAGYWIAVATSLDQALAKLEAPGATFQALVADMAEGPPASVRRLLKAARRRFPAIRIVCIGGRPARCRIRDLTTCDHSAEALTEAMTALQTRPAFA